MLCISRWASGAILRVIFYFLDGVYTYILHSFSYRSSEYWSRRTGHSVSLSRIILVHIIILADT
jgi:hypothetical protein